MPTAPSVDWVLSGNRDKASSRLQGFKIHEWLTSQGRPSRIVATDFNEVASAASSRFVDAYNRIRLGGATHVVFEGPEWVMVQLAQLCARAGKVALAVRCDPMGSNFDRHFDRTLVPTRGLADKLGIGRATVIEDMLDVDPGLHKVDYTAGPRIKVVWVGHASYESYIVPLLQRLKAVPEIAASFDFEIISSGAFATQRWHEQTVGAAIVGCDIAWIPIPAGDWYQNKSSNRLAMMHSLAMPVVASKIPSYVELARHGENGLYVDDEARFADALLALRDAPARAALGQRARATLGARYHPDTICRQWLEAFERTGTAPEVNREPSLRLALFAAYARAAAALRPT